MVNGLTKMEIVPIAATAKKKVVNRDLALKIALTQTGANGELVFWKATVEFAGNRFAGNMFDLCAYFRNAGDAQFGSQRRSRSLLCGDESKCCGGDDFKPCFVPECRNINNLITLLFLP